MITVMGYIHVDPAVADEFLADVKALTPSSTNDNGCLFYAIALDCALTGRMLIAERWRDQKSLTKHLETKQTLWFLGKWENRFNSDVHKYDISNERSLAD